MSDPASKPATPLYEIEGRELIAESGGVRVQVLTLAAGQCVPWHCHSEVTDTMVCLEGRIEIETRAPRETFPLEPGGRCTVPPRRAHTVVNTHAGRSRFLIVQGVGRYDYIPVS